MKKCMVRCFVRIKEGNMQRERSEFHGRDPKLLQRGKAHMGQSVSSIASFD